MEVTDSDFEEKVIEKSRKTVVVVDFWASWCVPCNTLAPIISRAVDSYKGKVVLAKVNVDENPAVSNEYNIDAIPSIKIFKNGKVVAEFTGVVPEDIIRKHIEKALR
jgi:putative thioredoxin